MDRQTADRVKEILLPHMKVRNFAAGDKLWEQGATNGMLVDVLEGRIKIFRYLPDGRQVTMYLFGPGIIFGYMPLLDGRPYPANAEAVTDVQAKVMSRQDFLDLIPKHPEVCHYLLHELSTRLRDALDQIERRTMKGTVSKVAAALSAMVPPERVNDQTLIVTLPVSAADYANLIGITPESLSRALTRLVDEGILHRLGSNRFQVLAGQELLRIGSEMVW